MNYEFGCIDRNDNGCQYIYHGITMNQLENRAFQGRQETFGLS
jgi:hypothetical protein